MNARSQEVVKGRQKKKKKNGLDPRNKVTFAGKDKKNFFDIFYRTENPENVKESRLNERSVRSYRYLKTIDLLISFKLLFKTK